MDSLFTYLPLRSDGTSYEMLFFNQFGTCTSTIVPLSESLKMKCNNGTLTSAAIIGNSVQNNPTVPFLGIMSKLDNFQIIMHNLLAKEFNIPGPSGIYHLTDLNRFFNDIYTNVFVPLRSNSNFVLFIIEGIVHTYVNWPFVWTANDRGCGGDATQRIDYAKPPKFCNPLVTTNGPLTLADSISAIASPDVQKNSIYSICYDKKIDLQPKCQSLLYSNGWNVHTRTPIQGIQNFDSCEDDLNCATGICNYNQCIPGPKKCFFNSDCAPKLHCVKFSCSV